MVVVENEYVVIVDVSLSYFNISRSWSEDEIDGGTDGLGVAVLDAKSGNLLALTSSTEGIAVAITLPHLINIWY